MCPDRTILSVYIDGELPSPFREKVARHAAECPHCAAALGNLAGLSARLRKSVDGSRLETAQARVWESLEARVAFRRGADDARRTKPRSAALRVFLRREIRLPLPLAAAAALAVFAAGAAFFQIARQSSSAEMMAELPREDTLISFPEAASYEAPAGAVNAANMREVLQYLEDDGDSNIVIIKLPERKSFNRYGEPRLITASDHPRRSGE